MFSIDCLEILNGCSEKLRKKLDIGKYPFNDRYKCDGHEENDESLIKKFPEFFAKRINVQAIVGKNGSGKSTLMDLMYLAINNFSYMFERGNKLRRPGADEMFYVPKLRVILSFSIQNVRYELKCNDNEISLKVRGTDDAIFEAMLDIFGEDVSPENLHKVNIRYNKDNDGDKKITDLVKSFFYTVVSNFSMQSFVDSNYRKYIYRHVEKDADERKLWYDSKYNDKDCCLKDDYSYDFAQSWISPIFHKNDGYIRSIVLNPYRHDGRINLSNEFELSKDRACSLFLFVEKDNTHIPKKKKFFSPYVFSKIKIEWNMKKIENCFFDAFEELKKTDSVVSGIPLGDRLILFVRNVDDLVSKKIAEKFEIDLIDVGNLSQDTPQDVLDKIYKKLYCLAYTKVKIMKIVHKYSAYSEYKDVLIIKDDTGYPKIECLDYVRFDQLLLKILADRSHITKKIRRIVNFLKLDQGVLKSEISSQDFFAKFKNESAFYKIADGISPQVIDDCLPPSIFLWNFYLDELDEHGNAVRTDIPYNQMSSGEIQFLQTIATHTYHVMNLISVPDDENRPKYKCINLVLDEVEICFHPEMQRQFLNKFIDVLTDLNVNEKHFINIIFITHSPFILSDIPSNNVLFLKEGICDTEMSEKKTFAGNIGEMFYELMFMKKTVGEFAAKKLEEKVKRMDDERNPIYKESQEYNDMIKMFDFVSDKILRSLLKEKLERVAK